MSTEIYIYSKVYSPAILSEGRGGLEDDLQDFMGDAGEITGGGGGDRGWNVDLEVTADAEVWLERICEFLRQWGVAEDTHLCVYPDGWVEGTEPREVPVFSP
jgi:hypothetical protein